MWVVHSTHQSYTGSPSLYVQCKCVIVYKMVNMRLPGKSVNGVMLPGPDITYHVIVVQYALSWEEPLLGFLQLTKEAPTWFPVPKHSSANSFLWSVNTQHHQNWLNNSEDLHCPR